MSRPDQDRRVGAEPGPEPAAPTPIHDPAVPRRGSAAATLARALGTTVEDRHESDAPAAPADRGH